MQFRDFSPTQTPTLAEQRDALRKGLGRARLWARAGQLADEPLCEACITDFRYDHSIDDIRGQWLWGLLQDTGFQDRLQEPIFQEFCHWSDERSASQLCQLALHYAKIGDQRFLGRIYEIVEQKPQSDCPYLAEAELMALDGASGFLFAASVRGQRLPLEKWDYQHDQLLRLAFDLAGEPQIVELLENQSDPAIVRFRDEWKANQQEKEQHAKREVASYEAKMRSVTLAELLVDAAHRERSPLCMGWGRYAAKQDLEAVLSHLQQAEEPREIANLLRVFTRRDPPHIDDRLFELCHHPDEWVRSRAFQALSHRADPRIREFALQELEQPACDDNVVELFVKNYQIGDVDRILQRVRLPDDLDEKHGLLSSLVDLLSEAKPVDGAPLAQIVYFETPCCYCRRSSVRYLQEMNLVPPWMREECLHDCEAETRALWSPKLPTLSD